AAPARPGRAARRSRCGAGPPPGPGARPRRWPGPAGPRRRRAGRGRAGGSGHRRWHALAGMIRRAGPAESPARFRYSRRQSPPSPEAMPHRTLATRASLREVRYDIRGELSRRARELEAQGRHLVRLNIGNPGAFGFRAPPHLQEAVAAPVAPSDPYAHQQGLPLAREAVAEQHRRRGTPHAGAERVFIGNGVSELIDIALRALLNPGEEVLLPSPDYPLWSAATILNGGRPVYYPCRPENGFLPDPAEIEALLTPRTRALVVINPNNPTGANYPPELLQALADIAARHGLLLMADEIYDGILYDDARFTPLAPLAGDTPCLSFGGLSKVWRACGWRVGWAVLSGDPRRVGDFHHAMDLLSAMRLCANVPAQFAVPAALS